MVEITNKEGVHLTTNLTTRFQKGAYLAMKYLRPALLSLEKFTGLAALSTYLMTFVQKKTVAEVHISSLKQSFPLHRQITVMIPPNSCL